jgi:hypothetical protein
MSIRRPFVPSQRSVETTLSKVDFVLSRSFSVCAICVSLDGIRRRMREEGDGLTVCFDLLN